MSGKRENLQEALCLYISDTLSLTDTVRGFCASVSTWMDDRKTELKKINKETNHEDLAAVLKGTLGGLEMLTCFLDAVEKLAVSSLHVFLTEKQVMIHLPAGVSLEHVLVIIVAARLKCPLLLEFKRDPNVFFLPKVENVEVLAYQLDRYMQTTQRICDILQICSFDDNGPEEVAVDLDGDLSDEDIERMLTRINQLIEIRNDVDFRMVYLFHGVSCSGFMDDFVKRQPTMLQFLMDLEGVAVQLDSMNKGGKISGVVGSSLGAVGSTLIITGLVLAPFTLGGSLALTVSGLGLGITGGATSLVTILTKLGVNQTQQKKADGFFQSFMDDVQSVQDHLQKVINQQVIKVEPNVLEVFSNGLKVAGKLYSMKSKISSLVEAVSDFKALESEEIAVNAGEVALQEGRALRDVPRLASEIPEVAMAAVKAPLRALPAIGLNVLFIGVDIFFICKDSIDLVKGSETELSKLIRARSALWKSEINSWEKIYDSLSKGLQTSDEKRAILESPFYCDADINQGERKVLCVLSSGLQTKEETDL